MSQVPVTREELQVFASELIDDLRVSARLYDRGRLAEAKRLAVSLRVLLHQDRAVMEQLGVREQLRYLDTNPGFGSPCGLVGIWAGPSPDGSPFGPRIGVDGPSVSFDEWWHGPCVCVNEQLEWFSRKQMVCGVANELGGAHVAAMISPRVAQAAEGTLFGAWMSIDDGPMQPAVNPLSANIRQIAYEAVQSFMALPEEICPRMTQLDFEPLKGVPPVLVFEAADLVTPKPR